MRYFLFLIVSLFLTNSESKPQNVETTISAKKDSIQGCGYRKLDLGQTNSNPEEFEKDSQYGEFPWMIGLFHTNDDSETSFDCGGSLIHPSVIVTTVQCASTSRIPLTSKTLHAGDWDISKTDEIYPHQERKISEVIIHENFTRSNRIWINNIALVIVDKPFEINENVNTICLPPANQNVDGVCVASGWGTILQTSRKRFIMKKIDLPIVPHEACEARFKKDEKLENLHESFICSGGETGKDTCQGDSGSPLACPISGDQGRYYQGGIIAWGVQCNAGYPTVSTNIPYFRNWIDEKFTEKNLEKSYYIP